MSELAVIPHALITFRDAQHVLEAETMVVLQLDPWILHAQCEIKRLGKKATALGITGQALRDATFEMIMRANARGRVKKTHAERQKETKLIENQYQRLLAHKP